MYVVNALSILVHLISSAGVVAAALVPPLQSFLNYGKTWKSQPFQSGMVARLARVSVPHNWFWHFYLLLFVLQCKRYVLQGIDIRGALLSLQALRRLFEQLFLFQKSQSRMHLTHYLVGLLFYTMESVAVVPSRQRFRFIAISLFCIGSFYQFACHRAIASTRKYLLPKFPITGFHESLTTACPHYGAEIIIYFAFVCLADPSDLGGLLATLTTLMWVVISLGVSGQRARIHYESELMNRRGSDATNRRNQHINWAVLPYMF